MKKIILCILMFVVWLPAMAASKQLDSLTLVLEHAKADSNKAKIYSRMLILLIDGDIDRASTMVSELRTLSEKINFTPGKLDAMYFKAEIEFRRGAYNEAIKCFQPALVLARSIKDKTTEGLILSHSGVAYASMSNYPEALKLFLEAMKVDAASGNKKNTPYDYNAIANVYSEEKIYDVSNRYYLDALGLFEGLGDSTGVAAVCGGLSSNYVDVKDSTKALYYAQRSLVVRKGLNDVRGEGFGYMAVGDCYVMSGEVKASLKCYLQSFEIFEQAREKYYAAGLALNVGETYMKTAEWEKAHYYLDRGLQLALELNMKDQIQVAYRLQSEFYTKKKDYAQALKYFKSYSAARDSSYNEEQQKKIAEIQANFESEKTKNEIAGLKQNARILLQNNQIQHLQINRNRYLITGLVCFVVLAIIISLLLINRNILSGNKRKAELEQKLLRAQIDPHFVFNSLVAIQNFVYNHPREVAADYISSFAKLMRLTLEASRFDKISVEREVHILAPYLRLQQLRFNNSFDYEIVVDPSIDTGYVTIPPFLAQPFVENAIEHGIMNKTHGRGFVLVKFTMEGNILRLEITDNGIGRERANAIKKDGHVSLATSITEERLQILNKKNKHKISLDIVDIKDSAGDALGTKVIINLPFE